MKKNIARDAPPDFERYAIAKPFFDVAYERPPTLEDALHSLSGVLVEIGAGDGQKLRHLIGDGTFASFSRIAAFDISAERISCVRELVPEADCVVADAAAIPLETASVDFIFSDQVIEHVPNDLEMVREMFRLTRYGGRAFVGSVIKRRGAWYFHRNAGQWRLDETHVREYSDERQFRDIFTRIGWTVKSIHTQPVAFPLDELALRFLIKLKVFDGVAARVQSRTNPVLRRLGTFRLRIPRYDLVYAVLEKSE